MNVKFLEVWEEVGDLGKGEGIGGRERNGCRVLVDWMNAFIWVEFWTEVGIELKNILEDFSFGLAKVYLVL